MRPDDVDDIDEPNKDDPQYCTPYINTIYKYLFEKEARHALFI
jgi:hypothetical protein